MNVIHITNSYNTWRPFSMHSDIQEECQRKYNIQNAREILHRTYIGMYIEWWIHNIGYYLTLPFKCNYMRKLNLRFKSVDLEEHRRIF